MGNKNEMSKAALVSAGGVGGVNGEATLGIDRDLIQYWIKTSQVKSPD